MTNQEAIKEIKRWTRILMNAGSECVVRTAEAQEMAIQALEKQIPKKPNLYMNKQSIMNNWWHCPCCNGVVGHRIITNKNVIDQMKKKYCTNCGQVILWERDNE